MVKISQLKHFTSLLVVAAILSVAGVTAAQSSRQYQKPVPAAKISREDDRFLEELSRRSFSYLWEQTDPTTGLTLDRTKSDGTRKPVREGYVVASSAATGFALTGLCIAAERNWVTKKQAIDRARATLKFYAERSPHKEGWFYHFTNQADGTRHRRSEISSIDTALLLGGVLTVKQRFRRDKEIVRLADAIYDRIDFRWMLNGDKHFLSHGWRDENGFAKARWIRMSEHPILYVLAIASRTKPIPAEAWHAWERNPAEFGKYKWYSGGASLFVHQYPQAWLDLRGRKDSREPFLDFYQNSVTATRAHREFCLSLKDEFPGYSENIWGISASDSATGYVGWGGPPRHRRIDGSVVPYAAAGSLMFTPDISLPALKEMKAKFGDKIYGKYGFADAFNPNNDWVNPDVIGIDLGITLIGAENLRSGKVWHWFMQNKEIVNALDRVGLK
ncbi:MAG: glucoamylase family protein [Pyrinomonadaceae bacterium]